MLKIFYPRMYISSIFDIKPGFLRDKGIRGVILDLDNTIIRRDSEEFSPEVLEWLSLMRGRGFMLGIVSNNSRRRVGAIANTLGIPAVHRAVKPWRKPFRQALNMMGTAPEETALIGDQIFTDIFGGNLAGLYTILVAPMKGREFIGTRMISRPLEKFILARLKNRPEVCHGKWD
ncbi:MAG TPA: YqeG family HAD IIIA-type phosphatase [Bacillota bacterium]|nr:YqeG family HAD IIIA-type phosphatase [Bacillota bacterium]